MNEPFAVEIYRRYLNGETVEALSADLEIPAERIVERLRAAAAYTLRLEQRAA
jgi:hypothetical protein